MGIRDAVDRCLDSSSVYIEGRPYAGFEYSNSLLLLLPVEVN